MKLVICFLGLFAVASTAQSTYYTNALNFKFVAYLKTELDLYPSIQHYELTYNISLSNFALLTPQSFAEDTYYGSWMRIIAYFPRHTREKQHSWFLNSSNSPTNFHHSKRNILRFQTQHRHHMDRRF